MSMDVEQLRKQLRERFPGAHGLRPDVEPGRSERVDPFDLACFPQGISEVVAAELGAPMGLLIAGWLSDGLAADFPELALVDADDSFDPDSVGESACSRMLWVRGDGTPMTALKAAELLIRDGNLPTLVLDVSWISTTPLRQLPNSAWWRLQQAAEGSGCRVVVLTPCALVPSARGRFLLENTFALEDLACERRDLLERVRLRGFDQRRHAN